MKCEICNEELTTEEEINTGVCNDCSCVVSNDMFETEQLFGEEES